mgnify:CR=1 FL=1
MQDYIDHWKELNIDFDCIYSGFLGSERQIQIVKNMITEFKGPETKVIVDPIMGDHGEAYATYTEAMCRKMKGTGRNGRCFNAKSYRSLYFNRPSL